MNFLLTGFESLAFQAVSFMVPVWIRYLVYFLTLYTLWKICVDVHYMITGFIFTVQSMWSGIVWTTTTILTSPFEIPLIVYKSVVLGPRRALHAANMWWIDYLARWEAVHAEANVLRVRVPRVFVSGVGVRTNRVLSPRRRT